MKVVKNKIVLCSKLLDFCRTNFMEGSNWLNSQTYIFMLLQNAQFGYKLCNCVADSCKDAVLSFNIKDICDT